MNPQPFGSQDLIGFLQDPGLFLEGHFPASNLHPYVTGSPFGPFVQKDVERPYRKIEKRIPAIAQRCAAPLEGVLDTIAEFKEKDPRRHFNRVYDSLDESARPCRRCRGLCPREYRLCIGCPSRAAISLNVFQKCNRLAGLSP